MKTHRLLLAGLALIGWACQPEPPASTPNVEAIRVTSLPQEPGDPQWESAPVHVASLLLQDMVDPRLLEPSTQVVRVQAVTDASRMAFRLEWEDATVDDAAGPSSFVDACAVQLPREAQADLPAPQMGEAQRPVEIAYWRASWQAVVDGRGDTIRDLYPSAAVDHYPFEAAPLASDPSAQKAMESRYAPARALENDMAGPRDTPVQALVAEGPGTLTPDGTIAVDGRGAWSDGHWSVVIVRPLPEESDGGGQVAFAVWQGSHAESGARKMRTGWIPLEGRAP